MTAELPAGAEAIGRIMGLPPQEAARVLAGMYGETIAGEVLSIGRIWQRGVLTRRERSLVTIAALSALGTKERLRVHVVGALHHGASPEEIEETILTLMVYAGHARATEAIEVAREAIAAFRDR